MGRCAAASAWPRVPASKLVLRGPRCSNAPGYPTAGDARRGAGVTGGGQDPADRSLANAVPEAAFPDAVDAVRGTFSLQKMIMVGDRGMITTARIKDLREMEGMAWITCLRHPAIKKLMAGDGPLQLPLFDRQDLAEISFGDFPASG